MGEEQIKRTRRRYWRRRCRYTIPPPAMLAPRLRVVYDFFKELVDPATNKPFFIADHAKRFNNELRYVLNGDLSDPPGVEMYRKLKTLKKTGFVVYLCLRSSSQLEGYHLSLRETRKPVRVTQKNFF